MAVVGSAAGSGSGSGSGAGGGTLAHELCEKGIDVVLLEAGARQSIDDFAVRNVEAFIPDLWFRFMKGKLRIEAELACGLGGEANVVGQCVQRVHHRMLT